MRIRRGTRDRDVQFLAAVNVIGQGNLSPAERQRQMDLAEPYLRVRGYQYQAGREDHEQDHGDADGPFDEPGSGGTSP